ncbi:MAG: SDR family NAD(P)-dependent oxidoreductase [Novosphingobium sp.]|nr:SDR family NAD(P)-dependent oxidoreductase [Novosphingobium sp.]
MSLEGKVALVVGASRGMGKRMALELAEQGADIAIAARTDRPGQSDVSGTIHETADEIRALGCRALPVRVDLADSGQIEEMLSTTLDHFGHIDILVHSVQYMGPGYLSHFLDTTAEQLELQIKVNLLSAMHATRLVAPGMAERGGGLVVLISSAAGTTENPNMPGEGSTGLGYPVTKAGLNRFVSAVEKELRPHNVAVVAVDPGFTLSEHVTEGAVDQVYNGWPLEWAHGIEVPATTVRELCCASDPMAFSGQVVVAADYVKEHGLL